MIKDVYHYLQSRSRVYPWIDHKTFRDEFLNKLGLYEENARFNMAKLDVIISSTKFSSRFDGKIDKKNVDIPNGISRFMFIELLYRISKFLFATREAHTIAGSMELENQESVKFVSVSQAFRLFVSEKIMPFYTKMKIEYNSFRVLKLHSREVESVFTMNKNAL